MTNAWTTWDAADEAAWRAAGITDEADANYLDSEHISPEMCGEPDPTGRFATMGERWAAGWCLTDSLRGQEP